jgi:hypothetical protein
MGRYFFSYPTGWVGYPTGWVSWLGNIEHKFCNLQKKGQKHVTPQSATYNMKTHQNFLVCNFDSLDLSIWLPELFLRAFLQAINVSKKVQRDARAFYELSTRDNSR